MPLHKVQKRWNGAEKKIISNCHQADQIHISPFSHNTREKHLFTN